MRAASAVSRLKRSRIGFLGHTYPGMLDMYSDFTQHTAQLGTHIEVLEMCDLAERLPKAGERAGAIEASGGAVDFRDQPGQPIGSAGARAQTGADGVGLPGGGRRWTGWWRISTSTGWPIITAAWTAMSTSAWAPV